MHRGGSVPPRTTIPPLLAVASVGVGLLAMYLLMSLHVVAAVRPALVVSELLLVAPGLLAFVAYGIDPALGLGLRPLDRRTSLLMVGAGASLWLASLGLLELQYTVWKPRPDYLEMLRRLYDALRPDGPADALVSVAAVAIIPAVCEETLIRGIVLPSLVRPLGATGAVVVSAAVFAIMHLDPYRTLFALAVGLALGLLRVRTGSLVACIVAHAVLNTITFVAEPFTDDPSRGLPDPRPALGLGLFLAGSAATFVVFRLVPSLTRRSPPPRLGA
jgi:membrane protease YdiL (CAAX protease family)